MHFLCRNSNGKEIKVIRYFVFFDLLKDYTACNIFLHVFCGLFSNLSGVIVYVG